MNKVTLTHLAGLVILSLGLVLIMGCQPQKPSALEGTVTEVKPTPAPSGRPGLPTDTEESEVEMQITSEAFADNQPLPDKYARKHEDLSPPLRWSGVPEQAEELALICEDPDAPMGTWTHWLVWGIHPERTELPEGVEKSEVVASLEGAKQGTNDSGEIGYGGPQPPSGTHRYFFRLYALSESLDLPAGAKADQVRAALKGKIVAEAETMGTYSH